MWFWHVCIKVNMGLDLMEDEQGRFRVRTHVSSQLRYGKEISFQIIGRGSAVKFVKVRSSRYFL